MGKNLGRRSGVAELFDLAQCNASSARKCRYPAVLYPGVDLGQLSLWPNSEMGQWWSE